jgi:hypothetical protein
MIIGEAKAKALSFHGFLESNAEFEKTEEKEFQWPWLCCSQR